MDRNAHLPDSTPGIDKIRDDMLLLFEESIGWKFRIKGSTLIDQICSVDYETLMVKGKMFGDFHIDLCELTNEETQLAN